jgi:hypothetical protein
MFPPPFDKMQLYFRFIKMIAAIQQSAKPVYKIIITLQQAAKPVKRAFQASLPPYIPFESFLQRKYQGTKNARE